MGGRGAFINIEAGDFNFVKGGRNYHIVGEMYKGVKLLEQERGSVKAPDFSHTANRIYAIKQGEKLKHLVFYDENHNQVKCIDLWHKHLGIQPHKHLNHNHKDPGIPITKEEEYLVDDIKRRFNLI